MSRTSPGIPPYLRTQWAAWRKAHDQDPAPVPDPKANPPAAELADYQRFRESIAEKWVARQSKAIHAADPDALVTVGLLQWSVPAQRLAVDQYTGFRPSVIAKHLDFLELALTIPWRRACTTMAVRLRKPRTWRSWRRWPVNVPNRACPW